MTADVKLLIVGVLLVLIGTHDIKAVDEEVNPGTGTSSTELNPTFSSNFSDSTHFESSTKDGPSEATTTEDLKDDSHSSILSTSGDIYTTSETMPAHEGTSASQTTEGATTSGAQISSDSSEGHGGTTTSGAQNSSSSEGHGDTTPPGAQISSGSEENGDTTTPGAQNSSSSEGHGDTTTPGAQISSGSEGNGDTTTPGAQNSSSSEGHGDTTTPVVKNSSGSEGHGDTTTPVIGCYKYTTSCSNSTDCTPPLSDMTVVSCDLKSKACMISETKKGNSTTFSADCVNGDCQNDLVNSDANGVENRKCCPTSLCNIKALLHAGSPRVRGLIPLMLVTLGVTGMFV